MSTPPKGKLPLPRLAELKRDGEPIVMVTAYDAPGARFAEDAGIDIVLVADGRADADLDRHGQVAHHPLDHCDLLRVLLAEVGAGGPDEVEELQTDGGDTAEVAGPVLALEDRADLLDVHPGLEPIRVDLFRCRSEEAEQR